MRHSVDAAAAAPRTARARRSMRGVQPVRASSVRCSKRRLVGTFKWALKAAVAQAEERASGMAEKASLDSESEGPIKYNDKEKRR